MRISISTVQLQEMVSRAVKGAGMNKLIPITSLMAVRVADHRLTLITTDASNTLYVSHATDAQDFYCVVEVEQFSKLISKMTCETTTLELDGGILTVKGNGTYKIELPPDVTGGTIAYPDPILEDKNPRTDLGTFKLSDVKTILNTCKASLAVDSDDEIYTGYYVGDRVVATDAYQICSLDVDLFYNADRAFLIPPELMSLLDVMKTEKIQAFTSGDVLIFKSVGDESDSCDIYGYQMSGVDDYEIEGLGKLIEEDFESSCKVSKGDMLSLLERIALFVDKYDERMIMLTFTDAGIDVSSKKSSGVETIPYISSEHSKPYTCPIDIDVLTTQIKASSADSLTIQYGNERSIKLVNESVTQVIALFESK